MDAKVKELIDRAQERYLKANELDALDRYVQSLPTRLQLYRQLRDREIPIMQAVADRVVEDLPSDETPNIEKGIRNLALVMRYCAMGMLLNDEGFLKERLLGWLEQVMSQPSMRKVNDSLYKNLNQVLRQELNADQLALMQPLITAAQVTLIY
ncbi:hypothetical protein Pse7367_0851 [Thalassoporum mexicanum PCC 7367]|uniref:hypothetical protein n=1 Tax=Thalassoporum mexicanum TaxID=3457544 RepID=UPI00029FB13C|nr:hypothetical protein [Pseudanabaena sp. PCC 7367]AFY69151.1 hypothetical protein Pse7367_0851 [Pseudanabaena sp. PCC 7367]